MLDNNDLLYLKLLRASVTAQEQGVVEQDTLFNTFAKHMKTKKRTITENSWEDILNDKDYERILHKTQHFISDKGLMPRQNTCSFFVNGELNTLSNENQYFVRIMEYHNFQYS